ncbi:MAG: hypothetical protein HUU14_12175 [Dehalococcoidia bacterium]|nr:hypothetical protein [Dehalococcoidia bacterium]MCL4231717.1 hypothetical protein [Dehalococcoidia bacterium]NUQ56636.1 hypothetical protein [Dehalococcoidia bacterium]
MSILKGLARPGARAVNAFRRLAFRLVRLAVTATAIATVVLVLDALLLKDEEAGDE